MTTRLRALLRDLIGAHPVAIAVSGGVDSLTLVALAQEVALACARRSSLTAFHAVSAAVPPEATARVQRLAEERGWNLRLVDAGETRDPEYLRNPVDRCRVCKTHLYETLVYETREMRALLLSGANLDDLSDYRPGLGAAATFGVRHPFIEAELNKREIRALARSLGLADVADLPAQPCLSSRFETGFAIHPTLLAMVNDVEIAVRARVDRGATVRCRVRRHGVVIEIEDAVLARLDERARNSILEEARPALRSAGIVDPVELAPYRMGSAFLRVIA